MSEGTSSFRLISALGGIAVFSGVLLSVTYELTKPVIAEKEKTALEKAVTEVIPGSVRSKSFYLDENGFREVGPDSSRQPNLYAGYGEEGERVGFALPGEARGYADVIRLLYGYDPDTQTVVGMQVLSSNETPGLGDRIEKDPEFQKNFRSLNASLEHKIVTVKNGEKTEPWQIDGISGATVSSIAVGKAVSGSVQEKIPLLLKSLEEMP